MYPKPRYPLIKKDITLEDLVEPIKKKLAAPEQRSESHSYGYGIKPGDKLLLQVTTMYDPLVIEAFVRATRELGATIDVINLDCGPDRELSLTDEIRDPLLSFLKDYPTRTEHEGPVMGGGLAAWAIKLAEDLGYDMIIGGMGGQAPKAKVKVNGLTFGFRELIVTPYFTFPLELWKLIADKSWDMIYLRGRGGHVRVTDPEGTDFTFTMHDRWYTDGQERKTWGPVAHMSHLMGHPVPPIIPETDATGIVAGTLSHTSAPFPRITVLLEKGRATKIEGGGEYGDDWRKYMEKTKDIQYPSFPGKGLFWLWEIAIGTNPKIFRLPRLFTRFVGGASQERVKSGYMHIGIGTRGHSPEEPWAAQRGLPYGHLHVHSLFGTYRITTLKGEELTVIDKGHLTALDDPDVRKLAEKYGNPDELLKEDWIPAIPGINVEGNYEEYAKDPFAWIKAHPQG